MEDIESARDEHVTVADRARLYPRVTSFRSRRGTLTPAQTRNWDALWPTLGVDVRTAGSPREPLDLESWFGREAPTILEIGSGTGTSTAAMAAEEPHLNVIAVEVYKPGIAQLLGLVDRGGLTNVRVIRGDAIVVLQELIGAGSLSGIRIFFPDPWPKSRHHKRRIIQSATVDLLASALVDGGGLHMATDHAEYADWIAQIFADQDVFDPIDDPGFSTARPTTKFEGRAVHDGRPVTEFIYRRRPRTAGGSA